MSPQPLPSRTRTSDGPPVRTGASAPGPAVAGAAALDVAAVLVFVLSGRRSHAEGLTVGGVADTSWPFLAALALGWVAGRLWRAPLTLRSGVLVWVGTVALGLVLRLVDRGAVPVSFAVVTAVVLGVLLVGWRGAARALGARA